MINCVAVDMPFTREWIRGGAERIKMSCNTMINTMKYTFL